MNRDTSEMVNEKTDKLLRTARGGATSAIKILPSACAVLYERRVVPIHLRMLVLV